MISVAFVCTAEDVVVGSLEVQPNQTVGRDLLLQRLKMNDDTPGALGRFMAGAMNGRVMHCPRCKNTLEVEVDGVRPGDRPVLGKFRVGAKKG